MEKLKYARCDYFGRVVVPFTLSRPLSKSVVSGKTVHMRMAERLKSLTHGHREREVQY
jgi:hypothetical protein